jgi:hypothetical protein
VRRNRDGLVSRMFPAPHHIPRPTATRIFVQIWIKYFFYYNQIIQNYTSQCFLYKVSTFSAIFREFHKLYFAKLIKLLKIKIFKIPFP